MSAHPAAGSNSKTQETAKRKRDRELGDARDLRDLAREPEPQTPWNQQTIARFVDRFLSWPLPETFRPDNGITFVPPSIGWPVGTNILNADEARAMFEHVLGVSK